MIYHILEYYRSYNEPMIVVFVMTDEIQMTKITDIFRIKFIPISAKNRNTVFVFKQTYEAALFDYILLHFQSHT